jgi:hypothetical protein
VTYFWLRDALSRLISQHHRTLGWVDLAGGGGAKQAGAGGIVRGGLGGIAGGVLLIGPEVRVDIAAIAAAAQGTIPLVGVSVDTAAAAANAPEG